MVTGSSFSFETKPKRQDIRSDPTPLGDLFQQTENQIESLIAVSFSRDKKNKIKKWVMLKITNTL